jgi:hypothetical protein
MRIICALPNRRLWAARSAMSSQCRYAADTIAKSIAVVMKLAGGGRLALTPPSPLDRCG